MNWSHRCLTPDDYTKTLLIQGAGYLLTYPAEHYENFTWPNLRLPNEADESFRTRAESAIRQAKELIRAALANHDVRFWCTESDKFQANPFGLIRNPPVRFVFDEAT